MTIAKLTTTGRMAAGLAAALGLCALTAAPALSQELYVRSAEPYGSRIIVQEESDYAPLPGERVIIREVPPGVVLEEAPPRVIVTEPTDGPYADEVYVREAPPFPPPAPPIARRDGFGPDCRTVEHETRSGLLRVSTYCD